MILLFLNSWRTFHLSVKSPFTYPLVTHRARQRKSDSISAAPPISPCDGRVCILDASCYNNESGPSSLSCCEPCVCSTLMDDLCREEIYRNMSTATIGIAGITGKLGSMTAENILHHHSVHVRGLCRDKSKLSDSLRSNSSISIVEGESGDLEAARSAVRGCSAAICCYLGPYDLMIDACIAENVPRYIASDYTVDYPRIQPTDIPQGTHVPSQRVSRGQADQGRPRSHRLFC